MTTTPARRFAALLLALVPVAGLTLSAAPAQASTTWYWYANLDRDSYWDAAARDSNDDGTFDDIWFDLDNDGRLDTHLYDPNRQDGLFQYISFDLNENGYFESVVKEWYYVTEPRREVSRYDDRGHFLGSNVYAWTTIGNPSYGGLAGLLNTMASYSGYWAR